MATYYMGSDGKFHKEKQRAQSAGATTTAGKIYTMNADGTFSLNKETPAVTVTPTAGGDTTLGQKKREAPMSIAQANAKVAQLPLAKLNAAKSKQTLDAVQASNDALMGTNDQTRAIDRAVRVLQRQLDEITAQQPAQLTPEQKEAVIRSRGLYNPSAIKSREQIELEAQIQHLQGQIESIKTSNLVEKDIAEFSTWAQEDQERLYRGIQAYADNEQVLVGAIERKLYEKYGKDAVKRIWESVEYDQGQKKLEAAATAGQETPDLINAAVSIPVKWLGSILTIPGRIGQQIRGTGRYGASPYVLGAELGVWAENVQTSTKEEMGNFVKESLEGHGASKGATEIAENLSEFAFGAGIQVVDTLAKAAAFGGVGTLALAATTSFEDSYRQAAENGASAGQALAMGVASGFLEVATEKIPLDNLFKSIKGGKTGVQALTDAVKQGAIELSTEEINYIGGLMAEAAILREKSGYQSMVRQAMEQGLSYEDAVEYADRQIFLMAAETAAMAFASGSATSAITSALYKADPSNAIAQQAEAYTDGKETQGGRLTGEELADALLSSGKKTAQEGQQGTVTAPTLTREAYLKALDEVVGGKTNSGTRALEGAVAGFQQSGTVSNRQAEAVLSDSRATAQLTEQTGVKLEGLTASQKRQAVKEAVAKLYEERIATSPTAPHNDMEDGSAEQTAVDRAQTVSYDNNNTTGGVNYGTGEAYWQIQDPGGAARSDPSGNAGTPAEEGNRSGVQGEIGRKSETLGRDTGVRPEEITTPFRADEVYTPEEGTSLRQVQRGFETEYGIPCRVVKASAWNMEAPAFIHNGTVYVSEGIDTADIPSVVPHESTHGMKQSGFAPYLDFIQRTADFVDLGSVQGRDFLERIANHVGIDPFDMSDADESRLYDELNAAMYGAYISGDLDNNENRAKATEAFPDLDGYLAELGSIHEQFKQEQRSKRTPAEDESVGAAPSGFDPISHMQYEYGTIPEGEKAVRDDSLPVSTDGKDRVSYTARTAKGAAATPDEFADLIDKEVVKGGLSYIHIKNSDTTQKAVDTIKEKGWLQAKADWHAAVHAGKTGADMSAMGALLLNNAANAGDKTAWREILHDYQLLGTNTAQGLQAFRILKTLAPEDKLYMIQRSVKQMVEDMQLDTDIELDEDLLHEFEEAETDEARDEVLDKITQNVADQIPSTFTDKFTALRYMNMLGNLRTQMRNVAGNAGMKAVSSAKNAVAAALETIASKLSGGKLKRTKSFAVSKEQLSAARADFDTFRDVVLGNGKYQDTSESTAFRQRVQDKKTVFRGKNFVSKALEGYRKATNWAMEAGDLVFSKAAYARALAGYLKANGVTETDYSKVDPGLMDEARLYAAKEAQEQTFRDTNWLSGWVSKVGRRKDTLAVGKLISEGIMPFRKTPANVLVRAEEYSPLGIINSAYYSIKAMQKGSDVTGAQVINSWAKTLTGSGIFVLGMLLSNLGILAAGPDEDEGKEEFEELSGYQNYALQFGDISYTIDWLTPAAMPLLMGAELWELIQDGGIEPKDIEQALLSIADPMVKMSMLQGIDDTLENISYADSNLGQLAANAALSYLTQGLTNTALGQIERSFEGSRMTTYVDKESAIPAWLQRAAGKASAKIPGWDYNQVPYINAWGEEEENPSWAAGLAYNMLSPGYIEKGVSDDVYNELVRLDAAQGDDVYPASPDKTITIDKQERNLSADEWAALAKTQGQTARGIVEDIISSKYYDGLSDDKKAEAIRYAYDYAREHARVETLEGYDAYSDKWMENIGGKEAEAILRKVATGEKGGVDTFAGLPIDKAAMLSEAIAELFDKPKETKPDGTSYTDVRTIQKVETVAGSSLTEKEQQAAMEDILDDKAYEKYLKILDAGYDTDDYAESYRIYLDAEDGKAETIREIMRGMGISYAAAKKLYEIYEPPKK